MPLIKGAKPGSTGFKTNIKREIAAGKPPKQAIAIAYSESRHDKESKVKHEHHKKEHHTKHEDHKNMHHHHKEMHKHHMKELRHHEKMMKHHEHHAKKK